MEYYPTLGMRRLKISPAFSRRNRPGDDNA